MHMLQAQGNTASQTAALAAAGANNEASPSKATGNVAGAVGENTTGAASPDAANSAANAGSGVPDAAVKGAGANGADSPWVNAQTPAPTQQPAQAPTLSGFPSTPVVIAPPANGFPATTKGPSDYGASEGAAGGPQGQQPNGRPQSVPAPPMINQVRDMISPLAPTEIRALHEDFNATRQAKAEQLVTPIPRISSISVDLSPGGAPPVVHTMINQPSALVFFDATGAPWPLAAPPFLASAGYFDVRWLKDTSDVSITATSQYETVGMTVYLKGLATPVVVILNSGEPDSQSKTRMIDARLDLRIPGRGPNAKASIMGQGRIDMYNDALQAFLDGVPPSGARRVTIEGTPPSHTDVWSLGDSLYLRTPLEIRSAFEQTMSSADGMHIYKVDPTPLIMVSSGGENLSLTLDIE